ncbi:MAG: esterase-like activity of phytase family protein [Acidimicrobiales bacterium]
MKLVRIAIAAVGVLAIATQTASATPPPPTLVGRAVLPAATYAPGPSSGAFFAGQTINGISFPTPSQPVQGFSAMVAGRQPGEYLAMPDNGFGNKANSTDFLLRGYYITPDFKTAKGGAGTVKVNLDTFIQFRDPNNVIGFSIQRSDRLLTGADLDPESLQRGKDGDLWMGEEFGPWILHFDEAGVLLEPPFRVPANLVGSTSDTGFLESPSSPFILSTSQATVNGSRGFESLAATPDGKYLYGLLEGATVQDPNKDRRYLLEFSVRERAFTGRVWQYRTQPTVSGTQQCCFMADMWALDRHRMVVIERDNGRGAPVPAFPATFSRGVYVIDLRDMGSGGFLEKTRIIDLTAIADPKLVSLPVIHAGDVQLGNPFGVACESIEAVHAIDGERLLLGCDNNFPNTGRNPNRADDNELIVVRVPDLKSHDR